MVLDRWVIFLTFWVGFTAATGVIGALNALEPVWHRWIT